MDFRRSVPQDATGIAELENEIFSDPWSYRDVQDLICTEGGMCFTALEDGKVIAYVIGRLSVRHLGKVIVSNLKPLCVQRHILGNLTDVRTGEKVLDFKNADVLFLYSSLVLNNSSTIK